MSGNQSISGSLSVAGSIVTPTLTATSGTVSNLSCNSLSVTGSGNATFQNLTTTAATTSTLMATSQVSTPTLYIGTTNAGTAIATLQQDLDAAEASLQTVVTKTNNQSFSSGTNTTTFTGTVSIPSTLMVGGSNVADRVSSLESKTTTQSYNSSTTETAFSGAVTLNGGASVPLGKTLLVDGSLTAASATVGGALQTNTLTASGLVTANGGVTVPSSQVLTLQGNLSANSTTVTPAHVSRIQGLSSNAQTQLNALQAKTNNQSASGSTTTFSGPVAAPSVTLNGADLGTRLTTNETNIASKATANNTVLTGTTTAADVNATNVTVSNIVAPRYLVLKDNDGPEQSVIYQDEEFLHTANQYDNGHIRFAVKDTSSVQKIPLDLHYSGATFEVPVTAQQLTATNATIPNATLANANITSLSSTTLRTTNEGGGVSWAVANEVFLTSNYVSTVPGHPSSGRIGTITAPAKVAAKTWVSCPVGFAHSRAAPTGSAVADSRTFAVADFRWILVSSTGSVLASGLPRYQSNGAAVPVTRTYTFNNGSSQTNLFYKQYITNVVCEVDIPYSETAATYDLYLSLGQVKVMLNYSLAQPSNAFFSMRSTDGGYTWYSGTSSASYVSVSGSPGDGFSAASFASQLTTSTALASTLETGGLATNSLAVRGPIVSASPFPSYLGGYITGSAAQPVFCSVTSLATLYGGTLTDNDWAVVIFPGWRFVLCRHSGYAGEYPNLAQYDNTSGTSIKFVTGTTSPHDLGSLRAYYNGVEVTVGGLS